LEGVLAVRDERRNEIRKRNILFLLDKKGLTRTELAEMCDMKYSQLNKYIGNSASRLISDLIIERIEKAFGLGVDDLDEDITGHIESNPVLDTALKHDAFKKQIDDVFLTIPLFKNIFTTNVNMDEDEESNVDECYLEHEIILNCGIKPKSIKALQYFNYDKTIPLSEKSILFFDATRNFVDKEYGLYLVFHDETRKVLQLNSNDSFDGVILGRIFFTKQFF
jgi:transcriptional regulator with XRE-family HTH domain